MSKNFPPILLWSFFIAALTGFLHLSALYFYLYYFIPWIDMPIHFFGGLLIGLLTIYFLSFFQNSKRRLGVVFVVTLAMTILVGIGWELFEAYFKIAGAVNYLLDTSSDLTADVIGGSLAFAIFTSRLKYFR